MLLIYDKNHDDLVVEELYFNLFTGELSGSITQLSKMTLLENEDRPLIY